MENKNISRKYLENLELQTIINNTLLDKTLDKISPVDMNEVNEELSGIETELNNLFSMRGGENI